MTQDVTLPAAALAGLLSFLSPCVLPLVPPYLTFIAGTTIEEVAIHRVARARRAILLAALLFVSGFSTVFVGLGATASTFGQLLHEYSVRLSLLAGAAIIVMGLHFLGVFRFAFLYREARVGVQQPPEFGVPMLWAWPSVLAGRLASALFSPRSWRLRHRKRQLPRASCCSLSIQPGSACHFYWRRSPLNPLCG